MTNQNNEAGTCPVCGAKEGEECKRIGVVTCADNSTAFAHQARIDAAKEKQE